MQTPAQIREQLSLATGRAQSGLAETEAWLVSATARELLRIDHYARQARYPVPVLGRAKDWKLKNATPVVAALASMHPDGRLREQAVRVLCASVGAVSDRALAVRVTDHVEVVRELAEQEVLRRTTVARAERIVPLLQRISQRWRGSQVLGRYLRVLVAAQGEESVWACLRSSGDFDVRRTAFRHSFENGLLGLPDAVGLLPRERDQVVRRKLIQVIADSGTPEVVAGSLLRGRSAESRVLGLVKLTAAQLDSVDVEQLLVDRSVLVRLWARLRWQEMGRDPVEVYAAIARSAARSAVRARAYAGLAETGTELDRAEIAEVARSADVALKKIGLSLLRGKAVAAEVPWLLREMGGGEPTVARLAGDVLGSSPQLWSLADLAVLKDSPDPVIRRRGWWLHRSLGGWEAVIADLEFGAAWDRQVLPMYFRPTAAQQQRIAGLLDTLSLDRGPVSEIAFAAGLPR
ncbi:hypothetical protein G3I59_28410 [Amycolatopsis rubida]|uniref:HEAT repeat domain-containing protein n=1 Tax=Amycolatopsis rubida TaxID=112413 RepID=A0ABX0BVJ0_9PSEU|nr:MULTISPECIES: hypothetical protein [Amycolatopsis]MYW94412.1 hypothetical protein [Amycolatopsis rubida]NEC59401.1 hypothetical protein [Amycolatopsis rubida]OAP27119.1 hypothetical protein A4R44_01925 [Amycolatopsis sp. M39]